MSPKPLYEVAADYHRVLELIYAAADDDGAIPEECTVVLNGVNNTFAEKIDGCCAALADIEATRDGYEAQEKRLKARRQTADKQAEWLRKYIFDAMQTA